jgi:hypothetical protein
MRTAPYGGDVHAPRKPTYSIPLLELTTLHARTCNHLSLDTKPNKNLPKVPLPTNARNPAETPRAGRPGYEMRPRDGGGTNTRLKLLMGQLHTSPPHAIYLVKIREQAETDHPRERDTGRRPRSEGAT